MATQRWKKQATVVYGYSLSRMALNAYMYADGSPFPFTRGNERVEALHRDLMEVFSRFLKGEPVLAEASGLRKRIIREMEAVVSFTDAFQVYETAFERINDRFEEPDPDKEEISDEDLTDQLVQYIREGSGAAGVNSRVSEVIERLPLRMTRQKYYGMMEEGLMAYVGSELSALEQKLDLLKEAGIAGLHKEAEAMYPELAQRLNEVRDLDLAVVDEVDYTDAMGALQEAGELLYELSEHFQVMQDMVNDMCALSLVAGDAAVKAGEDSRVRTLLAGLEEYLLSGEKEIPQKLEDMLYHMEGMQESYYEKFLRLTPAPAYREGEDLSEKKGRCVEQLLSTSSFAEVDELEGVIRALNGGGEAGEGQDTGCAVKAGTEKAGRAVTRQDVEAAMKDYQAVMDPVLTSVRKPIARVMMADTLAMVPLSFPSLEAVRDYIRNSLDACSDEAEKSSCKLYLTALIRRDSFDLEAWMKTLEDFEG